MMHHLIRISDEIQLTNFEKEDAESIARYIHDRSVYENTLQVPYPYTMADAYRFIDNVKAFEKEFKKQKDWAIRIHGEVMGGIGLLFNFGVFSHRSEIGYWLAKHWRGQGIMKAIIQKFTDFCFDEYQIIRLEAHVFSQNLASQKVLVKNGFEKEGLVRVAYIKDGKYLDAYLFSKISEKIK